MKKYNLKYVIMNQTMYVNVCIYIYVHKMYVSSTSHECLIF